MEKENQILLKAVSDPINRAILLLCMNSPRRPIELASHLKRTRVAIDKRAKFLVKLGLLSSYNDERGRKYYMTTDKGKWCVENYPELVKTAVANFPDIEQSENVKKVSQYSFKKSVKQFLSPTKAVSIIFLTIGIVGFFIKLSSESEAPLERGLIVLLFWFFVAILWSSLARRFLKAS